MDAIDLARRINDNLLWSRVAPSVSQNGDCGPMDFGAQIEKLWREPDEAFATALFLLLLGRMPEPEALESLCGAMAAGLKRADAVRAVALSDEALMHGPDVSWLSRLDDPALDPPPSSFVLFKSALWRWASVWPRGVWAHIKNRLRRTAPTEDFVD